jgi:Chalcone isomerase-like
MTTRRIALTLGLQAALLSASSGLTRLAQAQAKTETPVPTQRIQAFLQTPRLIGQQRLTYWGFDVYDISLWANASFPADAWAQQTLVLDLRYLRDFRGTDIAQRSIDEIQRQQTLTASQQHTWTATLQALFPNVRRGEALTGAYVPDKGMQLFHQDRPLGELRDSALAQRFLGIWLAPETSQRQLRQHLLAGA